MTDDRQIVATAACFAVSDIAKSAAYYADALGFRSERLWGNPPSFCMPKRDGVILMLSQAKDKAAVRPAASLPGAGVEESFDAYFWVRDVDALFAEMKRDGAAIVFGPVDRKHFGLRELAVRDPDGYVLVFASELA